MDKQQVIEKWGLNHKQSLGSGGHVYLVDLMGNDAAIVQAARCSYGAGTTTHSQDRDLLRYLVRQSHTTPIEMCVAKFHIQVPMDLQRQNIRHRMSTTNEYSTRYSLAIDDMATTAPTEWRLQSTNNKQGSGEYLTKENCVPGTYTGNDPGKYLSEREAEFHAYAENLYKERIEMGVAREQARKDLPLSNYTNFYWKIDLHNLFHYLRLRLDSHAQLEIRQLATAISNIVRDWVPIACEAFEDYVLKSMKFSAAEQRVLNALFTDLKLLIKFQDKTWAPDERAGFLSSNGLTSQRERIEFVHKLNTLLRGSNNEPEGTSI